VFGDGFGGRCRVDGYESWEQAAGAVIAEGRRHGVDLSPLCVYSQFLKAERYIYFRRLPGDGFEYGMNGPIKILPREAGDSAHRFQGMWHEAGRLDDAGQAFAFLKAWVLDGAEVEELPFPERHRTRWGVGGD
jgi:hypothetical protein